jgi:hypothetical protein
MRIWLLLDAADPPDGAESMELPEENIELTPVEQNLICFALRGRTEELLDILENESYRPEVVHEAFVAAAFNKKQQSIELLVDRLADINYVGYRANTALEFAIRKNARGIISLLRERGAVEPEEPRPPSGPRNEQEQDLLIGAKTDDLEKINKALDRGVDLAAVDTSGWTALMNAADRGLMHIVVRLVEAGADVNELSTTGQTALDHALHEWSFKPRFYELGKRIERWRFYRKKRRVAKWLIAHGAVRGRELGIGTTIIDPIEVELKRTENLSPSREHMDAQIYHIIDVIIPEQRRARQKRSTG